MVSKAFVLYVYYDQIKQNGDFLSQIETYSD